jgi:uncharacterized membrane protein YkvA (DUF1232 family)
MQTDKIRGIIKEANVIETNTGNLATAIKQFAAMRGVQLAANQIQETVQFVRKYVEHVPALLEQISAAARAKGVYEQVNPILKVAEDYFIAPLDVIPDYYGLLGLVDDAYLAHSLMQSVSDSYQQKSNCPLLPADMKAANLFVRNLIGEPHASMLDAAVANALGSGSLLQQVQQILGAAAGGGYFNMGGQPDPVWGNASVEEIANVRLGAMGVV